MLAPAPARDALLMAWEQPGAGNQSVRWGLLPLSQEPWLLDQAAGAPPIAAWSPNGAALAVYGNSHTLRIVDTASGKHRELASSTHATIGARLAWTAKGELLAAIGTADAQAVELRLYNPAGGEARAIATLDSLPDFVAVVD